MSLPYDPQKDAQLEALIQKKLSQLYDLPAPASLMPRVLAAIEARRQLPWWHRSWSYWPRACQIALAPLLLASAALVVYMVRSVWQYLEFSGVFQRLVANLDSLSTLGSALLVLANSLLIFARVILAQPLFLAGLLVIFMMYVTCIGLGSFCFRLLFNKR